MPARALVTSYSFDAASDSRAVTIPVGCDVLEVAVVTVAAGVDQSGVTVAGAAATKDGGGVHSGGKPRANVWRRTAPSTGSQTIAVTNSGGADKTLVVVCSWTDIDTTTPFGGFVSANGTSATPASASVTSEAGDLVADLMGSLSASAYNVTGGQTEIFDADVVAAGRGCGGHEAGAASVSTAWSSSISESKEWVVVAWNANAPAGGPADLPLQAASGVATASLALTAPTQVPLAASAGAATGSLTVHIPVEGAPISTVGPFDAHLDPQAWF